MRPLSRLAGNQKYGAIFEHLKLDMTLGVGGFSGTKQYMCYIKDQKRRHDDGERSFYNAIIHV
jgi:hypothetical protein